MGVARNISRFLRWQGKRVSEGRLRKVTGLGQRLFRIIKSRWKDSTWSRVLKLWQEFPPLL